MPVRSIVAEVFLASDLVIAVRWPVRLLDFFDHVDVFLIIVVFPVDIEISFPDLQANASLLDLVNRPLIHVLMVVSPPLHRLDEDTLLEEAVFQVLVLLICLLDLVVTWSLRSAESSCFVGATSIRCLWLSLGLAWLGFIGGRDLKVVCLYLFKCKRLLYCLRRPLPDDWDKVLDWHHLLELNCLLRHLLDSLLGRCFATSPERSCLTTVRYWGLTLPLGLLIAFVCSSAGLRVCILQVSDVALLLLLKVVLASIVSPVFNFDRSLTLVASVS